MKQYITIVLFVCLTLNTFANTVTKELAAKVASNYLFGTEHPVKSTTQYGSNNNIFVVNFTPEGWALVSGKKNARPVIAYSHTGSFNSKEVTTNIKDWLDTQESQISSSSTNTTWKSEWHILEERGLPVLKSANSVEPLLEVEWDQDAGWNRFCPEYDDGPGGKAYVGCVAVAMAQALHYLQYPERPQGEKSYRLAPYGTIYTNFDEEPTYQWDRMSLHTPDDFNAQLLYNCAVAVEMDFGGDGSGAYTSRVPFALQRYFNFTSSVKTITRYEDTNEWISLLKSELDKKNVLIYSGNPGTGEMGHAFNIDGYAPDGFFHFNWGWSGKYNGYFSINNVAPGEHDFTTNQKVVIGISKPYWGPTDIMLSNNTVLEKMPSGTIVGDIEIIDESENDIFTIEVLGDKLFLQEEYAPAKFYEENMKLKTLEELTNSSYPEVATIIVTDSEGNTFKKRFEIQVKRNSTHAFNVSTKNSIIYPIPAKNEITIANTEKFVKYSIINQTGSILEKSDMISGRTINTQKLNNGIYFILFESIDGKITVEKLIVEK